LGEWIAIPIPHPDTYGPDQKQENKGHAHDQRSDRSAGKFQGSVNRPEFAPALSGLSQPLTQHLLAVAAAHLVGVKPQVQCIVAQEPTHIDLTGQDIVIFFLKGLEKCSSDPCLSLYFFQ